MYFKNIYFLLSILQIRLHIYVRIKNMLQLYVWYTDLVYLKSAKLGQLILCLMHFTVIVRKYCSAEVQLKIY